MNEVQNGEDPGLSDDEAEITDFINKVEHMKKERSILWLQEFRDWMDISSDRSIETSKKGRATSHHQKEHYFIHRTNQEQREVSRYASDSVLASGDESSMSILESDSSFADMSAWFHRQQYFDYRGSLDNASGASLQGISSSLSLSKNSHSDTICNQGAHRMTENVNISPLTTINDLSGSQSSSICPTSPPHFQEDLLHRRHHLVEEILQLSADSFSMASSDSNTSSSEVDYTEYESSVPVVDSSPCENPVNGSVDGHKSLNQLKEKTYSPKQGILPAGQNGICSFGSSSDPTSKQCSIDFTAGSDDCERALSARQDTDLFEKKKIRRKAKKRVISILEENIDGNASGQEQEQINEGRFSANLRQESGVDDSIEFSGCSCSTQGSDDFIVTYFNTNIGESEANEVCSHCMRCNCVLQMETIYKER